MFRRCSSLFCAAATSEISRAFAALERAERRNQSRERPQDVVPAQLRAMFETDGGNENFSASASMFEQAESFDTIEKDGDLYVAPSAYLEGFAKWIATRRRPTHEGVVVAFCAGPQLSGMSAGGAKKRRVSGSMFGGSTRYGIVQDVMCPDETCYIFHVTDLTQGIPHRKFHPRRTIKLFTKVRFSLTEETAFRNIPRSATTLWSTLHTGKVAVDVSDENGKPLPLGPPVLEQIRTSAPATSGQVSGGDSGIANDFDAGNLATDGSGGGVQSTTVGLPKFRPDLLGQGSALLDHELEELYTGKKRR